MTQHIDIDALAQETRRADEGLGYAEAFAISKKIAPFITAALAAAEERGRSEERDMLWFLRETAPEDGTVILAYRQDAGVFTAHFIEEDAHISSAMRPPEGEHFWFTTGGEDLTGDMFTHWKHLPAPPAITKEPTP